MKKILVILLLLLPNLALAQSQRNPCVYGVGTNLVASQLGNCLAVGYYLAGATGVPMPVGGIANASSPTFTEAKPGYLSFDLNGNLRVVSPSGGTVIVGNVSNASSGIATTSTNVPSVSYNYGFNGATWDQLQVDANKYLKTDPTSWAGGVLGAMASYGTSPGAVLVPGVNAFVTNPIPAGQNSVGNFGSNTKRVCVNPTVTSATYGANIVVGGLLTFSNLFTSTGSGVIQSISLNFTSTQTVGFTLFPFAASPTNASTWTDHSAAAISGFTDIALTAPPISLTNANSALGAGTNYSLTGIGQSYSTGSTSGYFILLPNATTAATGGTASVISLCVTVLQDS